MTNREKVDYIHDVLREQESYAYGEAQAKKYLSRVEYSNIKLTVLERNRISWPGKSDEWLFERLSNELKGKVKEIHRLLDMLEDLHNINIT